VFCGALSGEKLLWGVKRRANSFGLHMSLAVLGIALALQLAF